jgi:hypothetical protein
MSHLDRYYRLWRTHVLQQGGVKKFWTTTGRLNEARLKDPNDLLKGYFLDFSLDAHYPGPFDSRGVPMIDYGGTVGVQYNPWAVGHFALAVFHKFLQTGDAHYHAWFLALADWFVTSRQLHPPNAIVWAYNFAYPPGLKAPWFSALAQSVAVSVLLRSYLWTGNSKYLETAQGAFQAFTLDVSEGGVSVRDSNHYLFFEETIPVRIYHILNGFISSLWGVYEYYVVTQDHQARVLFKEGLRSLEYYLPQYDVGWTSLYSLSHLRSGSRLKDVASPFYHELHVKQLDVLYRLSGCALFAEYRQRWESYLHRPLWRARTLAAKAAFKLVHY